MAVALLADQGGFGPKPYWLVSESQDHTPYLNCLLALAVKLQRQADVTGARGGGVLGQESGEQRAAQLALEDERERVYERERVCVRESVCMRVCRRESVYESV